MLLLGFRAHDLTGFYLIPCNNELFYKVVLLYKHNVSVATE